MVVYQHALTFEEKAAMKLWSKFYIFTSLHWCIDTHTVGIKLGVVLMLDAGCIKQKHHFEN